MGYINPLLKLPAGRALMALPDSPEKRVFEQLLRELRAQADAEAEKSWKKRKGPMAAYWRAVATYARHVAHVIAQGRAAYAPNFKSLKACQPAAPTTDKQREIA